MRISSTYTSRKIELHPSLYTNKDVSSFEYLKPYLKRVLCNASNQTCCACLSSYNVLCSLHTYSGLSRSTNPSSQDMKTVSCSFPFKNALLTSSC